MAAKHEHKPILKLILVANGVSPDVKDNFGRTPLCLAVRRGRETVARLLLSTDNVDPNSKDSGGTTPLSLAAADGQKKWSGYYSQRRMSWQKIATAPFVLKKGDG